MASSHSYWLYISHLKEVDVCLFVCFPECIYTLYVLFRAAVAKNEILVGC